MDIQAVSGAATVAVAGTTVFFLIAKAWQLVASHIPVNQSFTENIMQEAAEGCRRELQRISRKQLTYISTGLVFLIFFAAASFLNARQLYSEYPVWQLYLLLFALSAAAAYAFHRLARNFLQWRNLVFERDANIAIGQALLKIASDQGRVFHDVSTEAGTIDHVLVCSKGVFAVNVLAVRHGSEPKVSWNNSILNFSSAREQDTREIRAKVRALGKELSALCDSTVKAHSVIGVPGWDIESQSNESQLLVNENNLPMIQGWSNKRDYLMNESIQTIQSELAGRCLRTV